MRCFLFFFFAVGHAIVYWKFYTRNSPMSFGPCHEQEKKNSIATHFRNCALPFRIVGNQLKADWLIHFYQISMDFCIYFKQNKIEMWIKWTRWMRSNYLINSNWIGSSGSIVEKKKNKNLNCAEKSKFNWCSLSTCFMLLHSWTWFKPFVISK